jgi:hypothetical protein
VDHVGLCRSCSRPDHYKVSEIGLANSFLPHAFTLLVQLVVGFCNGVFKDNENGSLLIINHILVVELILFTLYVLISLRKSLLAHRIA